MKTNNENEESSETITQEDRIPLPNKFEFSSNISLSDNDKNRFQLIHATQLYGTFFGIYAQIICKPDGAGKTQLERMNFIGINYKGPINLELCRQSPKSNQILVKPGKEPKYITTGDKGVLMDIWVRASTRNVEKDFDVLTLDFTQYFQDKLESGNYLRVLRKLQRMDPNGTGQISESVVNGMFDSEYFVRDGLLVQEPSDISGTEGEVRVFSSSDFITVNEKAKVQGNPFDRSRGPAGAATINCTPSNLKMFL